MSNRRGSVLICITAAAALGLGLMIANGGLRQTTPSAAAVEALTSSKLFDLHGTPRSLEEWRGKIVVVNFWASWCAPCREEIPALLATQAGFSAKGLQTVGIALDTVANSREFAKDFRIDYPILLGDAGSIAMMRSLGNPSGGLPFTVVLDRSGKIVHRHLGGLSEAALQGILRELFS